MRFLVLGGTRFMGPFLVRALADAGHEVGVFHRGDHEDEDLPAEHFHGRFDDFERHLKSLRAFAPNVVIDMLALRPGDAARVGGFAGTANRAVVLSSSDVYRAFGRIWRTEPGPPDPVPLDEDSPLRAVVVDPSYDKVGVEAALRELPLAVTILRVTGVYGPGDYEHRFWPYLKRMDDGRPAILFDEVLTSWLRTRIYVENAAHAIALAATDERAAGETFNVAETAALTELGWAGELAAIIGWEGRLVTAPSELLPPYLREDRFDFSQDYVLDSSRIRRVLAYEEIVDLSEGLRRTVAWERTSPADAITDGFDYDAEDIALSETARLGS
jgi:nucleoside-diphosphate-sugar epimerase